MVIWQVLAIAAVASFGLSLWAASKALPRVKRLTGDGALASPFLLWTASLPLGQGDLRRLVLIYRIAMVVAVALAGAALIARQLDMAPLAHPDQTASYPAASQDQ